ncbi:hypothetical protein AK842_20975 [Salmonella enterica]|nr:hypothetical protein [Salmonella enterica]EAX1884738.1 hypothetical protein [Salmonella enterica]EBP6584488.1 hypothetical protein [Salmonella enterica]EBP6602872.1 hypothetical protein [Salmonella enterica]EBP6625481.1 hypothetical protein [Salmonella enterica]
MGSCAAPSAKGDDKFITTDYLQQCRGLQEHSGLIPGVDGQDLIGRTGGYAVGNWMVFSLMPTPFD